MPLRLLGAVLTAPLHRGLLVAVTTATLLGACAHATRDVKTPWVSATSINQWNEYANDLIARDAIGQVGADLHARGALGRPVELPAAPPRRGDPRALPRSFVRLQRRD